jgi:hypothetical protein
MLASYKDMRGFEIAALDAAIGEVEDLYFDDQAWTTRYLVIDTGRWLTGRQVLIAPRSVRLVDWPARRVQVDLTAQQIRSSPDIDTHKPVSRQQESALVKYYGWPAYWYPGGFLEMPAAPPLVAEPQQPTEPTRQEPHDPHLRSTNDVRGYHLHATDGEIGHTDDFIIDDGTWVLRYLVAATRNWLPGKHVLVSPQWVDRIDWAERLVYVDMERQEIQGAPDHEPHSPVTRDDEESLYRYYERPPYWR